MRALLFAALAIVCFLPVPALSGSKTLLLGDPQIGKGCSDDTVASQYAPYQGMSAAECYAYQAQALRYMLEYGAQLGIPHAILLGDQTQVGQDSDQETSVRGVLEDFEDRFTFHFVVGNHDMGNDVMLDVWHERHGSDYYHFVYKDVLGLQLKKRNPLSTEPAKILGVVRTDVRLRQFWD